MGVAGIGGALLLDFFVFESLFSSTIPSIDK